MPDLAGPNLVVIADLPCGRCGYALRGRPTAGRCPECGLAVEESIRSAIDLATIDPIETDFAPTRRATWSIPSLAIAAAIGTLAGLALPAAIVLAPPGFDPRGFTGNVGRARAHLEPVLDGAALTILAAGMLALLVTLASHWRRHARREARIAIGGSVLLLLAAGIGLVPGHLGLGAAADTSARGLGSLIRGGGQTPAPVVLIALVIDGLRALGVAFLVTALGALLKRIGRRSESYAAAGQGLQGPKPVLAATLIGLVMSIGWLAAIATDGVDGTIPSTLDVIAWPILWLVTAGATVLGGGYLAVNAIWATAPWRRPHQRLEDLVGPASDPTPAAASMADPDPGDRAP